MKLTVITVFIIIIVLCAAISIADDTVKGYLAVPLAGNIVLLSPRAPTQLFLFYSNVLDKGVAEQIRKVASGLRIYSPSVDPAGFALSEKLETIKREAKRLSINEEDWISYLQVADSALGSIQSLLQRIRELSLQSADIIYTVETRAIIQDEIHGLVQEIDRVSSQTEFNRRLVIPDMSANDLGVDRVNVVHDLWNSVAYVDEALLRITRKRALIGAQQSRAYMKIDELHYFFFNILSSQSKICDADILWETAVLDKNFIVFRVNLHMIDELLESYSH